MPYSSSENVPADCLCGDRPLENPSSDKLGYAAFADSITNAIKQMVPSDGFVIGIHAPWGMGKTTVLNFIKSYLTESRAGWDVKVVDFNPWWFSGQECLARDFFCQLKAVLGGKEWNEIRELLSQYGPLVSEVPLPFASLVGKALELARPDKNVKELRDKIASALRQKKTRILVVVDDVDRLTPSEIVEVFRLLKAVADFPNVIYLVAFDRDIVSRALEKEHAFDGDQYLEKIVQATFELPLPDRVALREMLVNRVSATLGDPIDDLFDQRRWVEIFFDGIDPLISTPRQITRLANVFSVQYPATRGEVNPVDLIAIDALQVLCPAAYAAVRNHPEHFVGTIMRGDRGAVEELGGFYDPFLLKIEESQREHIEKLLSQLFPRLHAVTDNTCYSADDSIKWKRERRVCSPDAHEIYFNLRTPRGALSRGELKEILSRSEDSSALSTCLLQLAKDDAAHNGNKIKQFLTAIDEDAHCTKSTIDLSKIVETLFFIGDDLMERDIEKNDIFSFPPSRFMERIVNWYLMTIDVDQRTVLMSELITSGKAISLMALWIRGIGLDIARNGNSPYHLLDSQRYDAIAKLVLVQIKRAAKEGYLVKAPGLLQAIFLWIDLEGAEGPGPWLKSSLADDEKILEILPKYVSVITRTSIRDIVPTKIVKLDPSQFEPFIDPFSLEDRINKILVREDLTSLQRSALEAYLKGLTILREGKDIKSSYSWTDD